MLTVHLAGFFFFKVSDDSNLIILVGGIHRSRAGKIGVMDALTVSVTLCLLLTQ